MSGERKQTEPLLRNITTKLYVQLAVGQNETSGNIVTEQTGAHSKAPFEAKKLSAAALFQMEDQMTGDILPPIKLGGHDDGSMTRTLRSSQSIRKDAQINKKLEQITEQLKAVRLQRSTLKKHDDGRVYGPKTDYSTVPKKFFSHPRLDYVYGEIMHSPYLTNPKDRYPKAVYTMSETIKELKHKGINFNEIPESERPYDQAQMKRSFIKEVCNYNPKFNIPKAVSATTTYIVFKSCLQCRACSGIWNECSRVWCVPHISTCLLSLPF